MKKSVKDILKKVGLYYLLQGNYRQVLFFVNKLCCRLRYAKFKGTGFICNSCGAAYSKFAPQFPAAENANAINANEVIAGFGENIICPRCLSTARERLILALLKNEIDLSGQKILHFSPEKNVYRFISKHNKVITADIEPLFYKRIDNTIKNEDATCLSFDDNIFDAVIGNHIMEHIPHDIKAMKEIYRVLKPGGRAILQVPYSAKIAKTIEAPGIKDAKKQSALFGQKDHVRIYSLSDYINRLHYCGFKVSLVDYENLSAYYHHAIQPGEAFISILK